MLLRTLLVITISALSSQSVAAYVESAPVKSLPAPTKPPKIAPTRPPEEESPFAPWPQPSVESRGDYTEEAFLEHHIGGPLYSKQRDLPRLPIPSLKDTIQTFLPTALPLACTEDERTSLIQAASEFPREARVLQERLLQRQAEASDSSSWLQQLWNTAGYLQVRDPVACRVSYFLFVPEDPTLPKETEAPTPCVARAAALLHSLATSRQLICSGQMPYESIQHGHDTEEEPLCSTAFKYLFHSCRIPQKDAQDTYHLYDPSRNSHAIVACRGQFFAVEFCNEAGDPLPLDVLVQRLEQCQDLAQKQEGLLPEMGWLTSADRDFWANSRRELIDVGGEQMKQALTKLESGAFVLNLDDDEEPESMTDAAKVFWYGGDSSGRNRWFDKSMQLVCTRNGRVGYVGEHSMLDAAPVIPLIRRMLKTTYKRLHKKQEPDKQAIPDSAVTNIFENCWSSPPMVAKATDLTTTAKVHHAKLTGDYELQVQVFQGYGKKFLKHAGFICHDFVQMAMQLAAYRLYKKQVATYEAASTRTFLHGRTETIRPVSPESQAFIECMGLKPSDDPASREEKLALLKQAASVHDEYQHKASKGLGVDRHFFGLSSMKRNGEKEPSLFSHPLYLRSKHWQLSTSSVIFAPGFGPVVDDGMGIGYQVAADSCMFTCTGRKENQHVKQYCDLLEEALTEMGHLVES